MLSACIRLEVFQHHLPDHQPLLVLWLVDIHAGNVQLLRHAAAQQAEAELLLVFSSATLLMKWCLAHRQDCKTSAVQVLL